MQTSPQHELDKEENEAETVSNKSKDESNEEMAEKVSGLEDAVERALGALNDPISEEELAEAEAEAAESEEADAPSKGDAANEKLAEMKDQLLRAVAETENVRRRSQRDIDETRKYATTGFARDMITVAENLYLALDSIPEEDRGKDGILKTLADGVEMTLSELLRVFEKHGIERVDPMDEKFDHNLHQAVSQVEDPKKDPGTVLQVMQAGYTMHDRLLRPAMVVVSKQGDSKKKVDTEA